MAADAPRMVDGDDGASTGTTGVWIGENDAEMLAEFDARFKQERGRSRAIKDAMRLYLDVHETLDSDGVDAESFPSDREFRAWVRQALVDQLRRESE